MRKQLYWLSDYEWQQIEPLLPRGWCGARRVDDRRAISGIVHMLARGRDGGTVRPSVASSSGLVFTSATWSRRAMATRWARASISPRDWNVSPRRARSAFQRCLPPSTRPAPERVRRSRKEAPQEHRAAGVRICDQDQLDQVGGPATGLCAGQGGSARHSIVVLPFTNIGGAQELGRVNTGSLWNSGAAMSVPPWPSLDSAKFEAM
jgi:transposase